MGRKGDKRLGRFVEDLAAICVAEMTGSAGVPEQVAQTVAAQIADRVCLQYARTHLYVPAGTELRLSPRDQEIWRKYGEDSPTARRFSARRIDEIAVEFGLTARQVYSIISMQRRLESEALQAELPGMPEGRGR